jgi:hypothetical protein
MMATDSYYGWGRSGNHNAAWWENEMVTAYNEGLWFRKITIAQIPQPMDAGFVNVPKLAMQIFNLRTRQGSYLP